MKRFWVQTMGCQMNMHDSRRLEDVFRARGYKPALTPQASDVIVLNTCSVRDKAEQKLWSAVGRFRELKQQRPELTLVVAGCMAQEHGDAMLKRMPLIDVVVGPDNLAELPSLVEHVQGGGPPCARTEFDVEQPQFLSARVHPERREVTAYVTVMKGCDERCSFCIVPYTRGPERYRPADDLVGEIAQLVQGGVREVTLVGQTVNSWSDPSRPEAVGPSQFARLLHRIADEVPLLARLRYTSPHPRHVTEDLVSAHRDLAVLPDHVHLPVQSGSDRILKRMIRRYTRDEYQERARMLQQARDGLTLSTDIIVGFPGETEEDFQLTLQLIREVGFVAAFAFKYSPRPNTPALRFGDDVPEVIKEERLARLFAVVETQQTAHLNSLVGTLQTVLIEGPSPKGRASVTGRTGRHEIVHLPGVDPARAGELVDVRIDHANKHSLLGSLQGAESAVSNAFRYNLPIAG